MKIQVRIRAPNGQSRLEIDDEGSLGDLIAMVKEKTGLTKFSLKYGYPLKNLDISPEIQSTTKVKDHGLRGETLVVAPLESSSSPAPPPPAAESSTPAAPKPFTPKGIEPDETSLAWPEKGGYIGVSIYNLIFVFNFPSFTYILSL